jgi:energy-coupling factor transport system ATP-binding protein
LRKKVLKVKDLWFRYPNSNWILKSLNLELYEGETLLVIGRSGCGKTTLIRALTGTGMHIYGGEARGEVEVDGKRLEEYSLEELRKVIQVVNQDPRTHFVYPNIYEDLYTYAIQIYRDEKKAVEALELVSNSLKVKNLFNRLYFELSGGELRRTVIAKAILSKPKIIIFDEPLMWLDDIGVEYYLNVIESLRSYGISILIFEHRFMPLVNHIDRALILANGFTREMSLDVFRKPFYSMQNEVKSYISSDERGISINNLWFKYDGDWVLRNIYIDISRDDAVAIYGSNGSGKSTLLKIIAGYLKPVKGTVKRFGKAIYIPQLISLFFTEESIELELRSICRNSDDFKKCYSKGYSILRSYGFDDLSQTPFNLSWGQQERLAIALALIANYNIFLLDEPFSGLTYLDRAALVDYLKSLPGAKIVTISSRDSIPFLSGFKLYSLHNGSVIRDFTDYRVSQRIDLNNLNLIYSE